MDPLSELYQELILDHNRSPRNYGRLERPSHRAEGYNPLCGDRIALTLDVADGVVRALRFEGEGCAISTASASLMSEAVVGRTLGEVEALAERVQRLLTEGGGAPALGKLAALAGVRAFPTRVKCATLAWHALQAALAGRGGAVTTEEGRDGG